MKQKQNCELCRGLARIHCESDQAILCWTCDFKVHTANFLVARHSRTLLCHVCQSPTPWTATGTKLGPTTVSVCNNCLQCADNQRRRRVVSRSHHQEEEEEVEEENHTEVESDTVDDEDVDDENEQEDEQEEDEEIDNQVVPWSPTTPPPPATSSSNSDEEDSSSSASSSLSSPRRNRETMRKSGSDLRLKENRCCRVSRGNVNEAPETAAEAVACGGGGGEVVDSLSTRSLKRRRLESGRVGLSGSSSWGIVESVKRLHRQEMGSAAAVAEFCRLSEDQSAVDSDSSECS